MPWDKRERATRWYHDWIEPVTEALYTRELPRARQLAYDARHAIARGDIRPAEAAEKAGLLLDYMEYFIAKTVDAHDGLAQCPDFEAKLSRPAVDPAADGLRSKLLLQFRISAERLGYRELEIAEFQELYDGVPNQERNDEFWHYASTWAFGHFHEGILEQAYEEYSVNKGSFMSDWLWWRVRLMYRLSAGKAAEEDALQLISNLTIVEHLNDFKRFIQPLEHAGLMTPLVAGKLEQRRALIEESSAEDIRRQVAE